MLPSVFDALYPVSSFRCTNFGVPFQNRYNKKKNNHAGNDLRLYVVTSVSTLCAWRVPIVSRLELFITRCRYVGFGCAYVRIRFKTKYIKKKNASFFIFKKALFLCRMHFFSISNPPPKIHCRHLPVTRLDAVSAQSGGTVTEQSRNSRGTVAGQSRNSCGTVAGQERSFALVFFSVS